MQPSHVNGLDAPVSGPKVRIGASEYEPRWSFLAEYILSTRNLTLGDVLKEMNEGGKRSAALAMELVAASVAHHFPAGAAPNAAHWAGQMRDGQLRPVIDGIMAAGRAAGAIVDKPKNEQAPEKNPAMLPPQ